ncbi:GNAT family N-acetyltransferase [Paenisporosarcina indica]|uniref:GNAT family N-acetyltransferase n=1 Tax=Paenisporosarcina indica TaxID=650093 RepID=UPI00094FD50F|nr:GNAT family protein [Paenisporosarcina indica]
MESSIFIREFNVADAKALLELNKSNRTIFEGITPTTKDDSFYTLEAHIKVIEGWKQARDRGDRYEFGIFEFETNVLIGNIGLYKFSPSEKCTLGYQLDQDHHGKGYATDAVRLILDFAFREKGFHRVEAGVMPRNIGSARVLEKSGFVREGLLRDYIKIKGIWEDHYMFSILETDL